MGDPQFWLDEEDGTIWTMGYDEPMECDNEEVVSELNKLANEAEQDSAKIAKLREALEFYADEKNWRDQMPNPEWYEPLLLVVLEDKGKLARAALPTPKPPDA